MKRGFERTQSAGDFFDDSKKIQLKKIFLKKSFLSPLWKYTVELHGIPWYFVILHGITMTWHYMLNCGIQWFICFKTSWITMVSMAYHGVLPRFPWHSMVFYHGLPWFTNTFSTSGTKCIETLVTAVILVTLGDSECQWQCLHKMWHNWTSQAYNVNIDVSRARNFRGASANLNFAHAS